LSGGLEGLKLTFNLKLAGVLRMVKGLLYLDDLHPGMTFSAGPVTLTEEAIVAFAREFDPQPFHTDPEKAKTTFFKGLIASGWQTVAVTMRLLVEALAPLAGGLIGFGAEISWPKPVRPGDELRVVSEIIAIAPSASKPSQGIVTFKTTTANQNGDIVQVLTSKNLVFKRGHAPGDNA
jgi:acyl dehydratase